MRDRDTQSEPPRSLDEAVRRLIDDLTPEMRAAMVEMSEEDLIGLHFGLGTAVRNGYGLHKPDSPLMADAVEQLGLGYLRDPDIVSGEIIERAWRQIREDAMRDRP